MEQAMAIGHISGRLWLRVVLVAAAVSLIVAGAISMVASAPAPRSEPAGSGADVGATITSVGESCRELISLPKRGWVCQDR